MCVYLYLLDTKIMNDLHISNDIHTSISSMIVLSVVLSCVCLSLSLSHSFFLLPGRWENNDIEELCNYQGTYHNIRIERERENIMQAEIPNPCIK